MRTPVPPLSHIIPSNAMAPKDSAARSAIKEVAAMMHAPSSFPSLPRGKEKPIAFLGSEETHRGGNASFSRFERGTTMIPSTAATGLGMPKALAREDCLLIPLLARVPFGTMLGPSPSLFSIEPLQGPFSPVSYLCVLLNPCAIFRTLEVTLDSNFLKSWVALGVKSMERGEMEMAFILWTANASESLRKFGSLEPQSQ